MVMRSRKLLIAGMLLGAAPAVAQQVVVMTPITINAALAAVRPGDTLRITGSFNSLVSFRNRDFGNVRVDASDAVFLAGFALNNVQNITITGGTFGRSDVDISAFYTIRVDNSRHVSFANTTVVGNGDSRGGGLLFAGSQFITVRDSRFSGHATAIGLLSSSDALVVRNDIRASTADGINIIDNQRVILADNSCRAFTPAVGAHPDCIQLWSLNNRPLQADIFLLNNVAIGNMQAYLSSDPKSGSGTRFTFAGNYASVSYPHTITCGNCTNSLFVDNVLANTPDARWGPAPVQFNSGTGNVLQNNQQYDLRGRTDGWLPNRLYSNFAPSIGGLVGSMWDDRSYAYRAPPASAAILPASAVPDLEIWIGMGTGFALVGRQMRRQRLRRVLA